MRIRAISKQIDIGCGNNCRPGYTGIDRLDFGQDIVWDVRNGLPLPDKSVDHIYTSHFIEHLTRSELEPLMEEIKRVLTDKLYIVVPHSKTAGAFDYAHRTFWDETSMRGFITSAGFEILNQEERGGNLITEARICAHTS